MVEKSGAGQTVDRVVGRTRPLEVDFANCRVLGDRVLDELLAW
jgi:hypothetical protein